MSKPKKGKKKTLSEGPQKVTNAEAALYNLEIEASEKKIERLRKHLENLDTNNEEMKAKIHSLKWERKDQASDLSKKLESCEQTLYEYNEELHTLTEEYNRIKCQTETTMGDLESKYKAMHDQLTSEIKLLKAQFLMITDFRSKQAAYDLALQKQLELYDAKVEEGKNLIELKELAINEEKQALLAEFKEKLYHVSSEFTSASAMKSSAYSQRLIRENIALDKEIELMERTLTRMERNYKEHIGRCERAKREFPKLDKKKSDLILMAQKKHEKIIRLTNKFEGLRKSYIDSLVYKTQFQDMVQYENNKNMNRHNLITQVKKLASRAHVLKAECQYMASRQVHNDREIERLCKFISSVKTTLLVALGVYDKPSKKPKIFSASNRLSSTGELEGNENGEEGEEEEDSSLEKNPHSLLKTLIEILRDIEAEVESFDSFENISIDSFVHRCKDVFSHSSEVMRALRESESTFEESEDTSLDEIFGPKFDNLHVVPRERSEHAWIFDVEKGSSFYISSGRSKEQIIEKEEPQEDVDEEQSSNDDGEAHSDSEAPASEAAVPTTEPAKAPPETVQKKQEVQLMPPGTIVDVVMEEEEDDEYAHRNYDSENQSVESFDGEEEMSQLMFY